MAPPPRPQPLRLAARPARLAVLNGLVLAMGAAALGVLRLVPQLLSPLAFWLLLAALAAALGAELLAWQLAGVRVIELDGGSLALRSGRKLRIQRLERPAVRAVRVRRLGRGTTITLWLRTDGPRGRRVTLRDATFEPAPFAALADRLSAWRREGDAPAGGSRSSSSRGSRPDG